MSARRPPLSSQVVIRSRPYPLPRPWASEEEYERFYHLDLDRMTALKRWAENERARQALAALIASGSDPLLRSIDGWPLAAASWLRERIERTEGHRP